MILDILKGDQNAHDQEHEHSHSDQRLKAH
jgi:hypothetical protein